MTGVFERPAPQGKRGLYTVCPACIQPALRLSTAVTITRLSWLSWVTVPKRRSHHAFEVLTATREMYDSGAVTHVTVQTEGIRYACHCDVPDTSSFLDMPLS